MTAQVPPMTCCRLNTDKSNVNLRICLWNATSVVNKFRELEFFLDNNSVDVALIIKTWLPSNFNLNFANCRIVKRDPVGVRAGGLAICIKRNIDYCILPSTDLPAGELLLIKLNVKPDFVLGAAYVAPRAANFSFNYFDEFFSALPSSFNRG